MKIFYRAKFKTDLDKIVEFIANDSIDRAIKFHDEIYNEISKIPFMPYRFRQNQIINDKNVRDLIFKGFVVPFVIKENQIEIYKNNLWKPNK